MLKIKAKPKRLKCKGYDLKSRILNLDTKYSGVGRALGKGIPVLSIFALLGIMSISTISPALPKEQQLSLFNPISWLGLPSLLSTSLDSAYAETYTATSGESSVSLTIGGAGETEQVSAGRGVVAYRSHTVRVKADVVKDYGLTISGPANLTPPSGGTTISGVSNKTGTEMGNSSTYDNTWGYGWGATTTSDANLTYRTLSTTGTNLLTVNGTSDKPALSNRAVDFTRKLSFAVKFGENAVAGRYYANVTLSLTATPSTITTYSITYNGNSNTSGTAPAKQEQKTYDTSSYSFTASTQGTLARSGYNFLGWSESPTATSAEYAANSTITLTQASPTKTLYAVWQRVYSYSLSYDGNGNTGGTVPTAHSATSANTSYSFTVKSGTPTKTGYTFLGWSTSSTATSASYASGNSFSLSSSAPSKTLYAVWQLNSTTYTLTLNANSGTGGPGSQTCTATGTATSCSITISSTKPTRTGYTFQGWNTNSSGTGTTYSAGGSITMTANKTLYAKWQVVAKFDGITNMQQMTSTICKNASVGDTAALTDARDSSTYTIKKINSTQCWMTQNLRIVNKSISSSNSDMISGSFTIPASSISSGFSNGSDNTGSNAYYPNDTTKGAYYSWCAATAGSCTSAASDGVNAPYSICPKGWHLPVGGTGTTGTNTGAVGDTKNDFMVMLDKTSTSAYTDASLVSGTNITLGGVTWPIAGSPSDGSLNYVGTYGYYWSRTAAYGNGSAYHLFVNNSGRVSPVSSNPRFVGYPIRCVAYAN